MTILTDILSLSWFRRIHLLFLSVIALVLPLNHQYMSPLIGLWILSALVLIIAEKQTFKINRHYILLMLFYILLGIGALWSENSDAAGFDMEVKMSLFIFPLLGSFIFLSKKELELIFYAFLLGLVLSVISNFSLAFFAYLETSAIDAFFYINLSKGIHPSYLSFYVVLGIVLSLIGLFQSHAGSLSRYGWGVLLIVLFGYNILLLSKIGIIAATVFVLFYIIRRMVKEKKYAQGFIVLAAIGMAFYVSYQKSPYVRLRVNEVLIGLESKDGKINNGTTGIRVKIWKEALHLIAEQPVFGYGTGDVKDELMIRYKAKGISSAYENRFNAHNQFLQTGIALGLLGLLIFLALLLLPLISGVKTNNAYIVGFMVLSLIYMFPESVLENQAGTIFFGLFYTLLNQKSLSRYEATHSDTVFSA